MNTGRYGVGTDGLNTAGINPEKVSKLPQTDIRVNLKNELVYLISHNRKDEAFDILCESTIITERQKVTFCKQHFQEFQS